MTAHSELTIMRTWMPDAQGPRGGHALAELVDHLAQPAFGGELLRYVRRVLPATSLSVYRTRAGTAPVRYFGVSSRTPDTTRDCWRAYVSGPHRRDRSLLQRSSDMPGGVAVVSHITANEIAPEHRAKVYEPFGMVERVSVLRRDDDESVFAVNFYRHRDTGRFSDPQIDNFGSVAPAVLALVRKHLQLAQPVSAPAPLATRERLTSLAPDLTSRELDVCERLLRGMTQEGVAADLGLGLTTVKTYRNRAFERLGIHFRSELFARVMGSGAS
jgi:DNA-binding CsgD family transcriptional regulator